MVTSYPISTNARIGAWSLRHMGSSLSSDEDSEALWQVIGWFQQFSPLHLSHPQVSLPPAFPCLLSSPQTLENLHAVDSCHRISRTAAFISSIVCGKQSEFHLCVVFKSPCHKISVFQLIVPFLSYTLCPNRWFTILHLCLKHFSYFFLLPHPLWTLPMPCALRLSHFCDYQGPSASSPNRRRVLYTLSSLAARSPCVRPCAAVPL